MLEKWNDTIWFGKHKGKTVQKVCKEDPNYLYWLITETDKTNFSQRVNERIELSSYLTEEFNQYEDLGWGDFQT